MDVSFFDRYRKSWNDRDVDAIIGFFAGDGIYEDVAVAKVNRGHAEIRRPT